MQVLACEDHAPEGGAIRVPAGFVTDLASVPRLFQAVVPVIGNQNGGPATVHDWCYDQQTMERAEADSLFLSGMEAAGVGWLRRWAMYAAVRVGGWVPWGRRAREIALLELPQDALTEEGYADASKEAEG